MVDDALSKILDPDCGHVRWFGFGVTHSKLSLLSQQDHKYKVIEKEYLKMKEEMIEMKALMSCYLKKHVCYFLLLTYIFFFVSSYLYFWFHMRLS